MCLNYNFTLDFGNGVDSYKLFYRWRSLNERRFDLISWNIIIRANINLQSTLVFNINKNNTYRIHIIFQDPPRAGRSTSTTSSARNRAASSAQTHAVYCPTLNTNDTRLFWSKSFPSVETVRPRAETKRHTNHNDYRARAVAVGRRRRFAETHRNRIPRVVQW